MFYISGIHALNIPCELDTGGDWHASSLKWSDLKFYNSDKMFFKNYGIEPNKKIPESQGTYDVANHIRALLDLLQLGKFSLAQGMNNDFICNEAYDNEIFQKVYSMKVLKNWNDINDFMKREYRIKWLDYIKKQEGI